jgi:5,6-dimethylbenzimidazole synthase
MEAELKRRDPRPDFDAEFRERFYTLLQWRRDVRRFKREPLPAGTIDRLIDIACLSPSVGLSEPWRFVIIDDPARRAGIRQCFEHCNQEALQKQTPDRATLYARLKLAGLDDAPCQIGVFADRSTAQGHGLGRLTMPESLDYSVAIAIHTLWLAARANGSLSAICASAIRKRTTIFRPCSARAGSGATGLPASSSTVELGPGCYRDLNSAR